MDANRTDPKQVLKRYLQEAREALLWKLDGLDERDVRLPRTPTGTNLLGLVKHCANVEVAYFGPTFGRPWPNPAEVVSDEALDADPQADLHATAQESTAAIVDFYRRVWTFADLTIEETPLDGIGHVPHWPAPHDEVTLHLMLVHVTTELSRHAGHADILREQIDGRAGVVQGNDNLPEAYDWGAYRARLETIADSFR